MTQSISEVAGSWSDGKTSAQFDATLSVQPSGKYIVVLAEDQAPKSQGDFGSLKISARLADTPRRLTLEHGAQFETSQNAQLDQLIGRYQKRAFSSLLHRMESHWLPVLLSLLISVGLMWSFVVYGIPAIATTFANTMPLGVLQTSDQQTLTVMDKFYFQESQIDGAERAALKARLLADIPEIGVDVKIEFRQSKKIGANAFALPGGTIVFTDEMLSLAENTQQIQAIFAHEVGHLVHRHSLRRLAQNSIITVMVVLLTGDATATSDLLAAIPFLLTDMAYSRQFENEADGYAWEYLSERNIDVRNFSKLMVRLECSQRSRREQVLVMEAFNDCLENKGWRIQDKGWQWSDYLLTHPPSLERIKRFSP